MLQNSYLGMHALLRQHMTEAWTYGDVPGQGARGEGGRAAWRWRGHPGSRRWRSAPPAPADEVDGGHGETRQRRGFDWPQLPAPAGEVDGGIGEAAAQV